MIDPLQVRGLTWKFGKRGSAITITTTGKVMLKSADLQLCVTVFSCDSKNKPLLTFFQILPMAILSPFFSFAVVAAAAANAIPTKTRPLMARTTIDFDEVVGFNQTVPDTTEGTLYTAYQPYLKVVNGCVPFPAVDAEGDIRFVLCLPTTFS